MSPVLNSAIQSYDSYFPYVMSWGKWARQNAEMPKNYRCSLGRFVPPESVNNLYPLISQEDAQAIDCAFAKSRHTPSNGKISESIDFQLVQWMLICGNDSLDVFCTAKYLKRLFREQNLKFDLLTIEWKIRDIIERSRGYLLSL